MLLENFIEQQKQALTIKFSCLFTAFITPSNARVYGSGRGRMNRGSGRGSSNGYSGSRGRGNYQNGRGGGGKCMNIQSVFFRPHVQECMV